MDRELEIAVTCAVNRLDTEAASYDRMAWTAETFADASAAGARADKARKRAEIMRGVLDLACAIQRKLEWSDPPEFNRGEAQALDEFRSAARKFLEITSKIPEPSAVFSDRPVKA